MSARAVAVAAATWSSALAAGALTTVAGLVVWSLLPLLLGWEASVVMSGSMRPGIREGDVVLVQPVDPAVLVPGHVVLFEDRAVPGRQVLHRVVDVAADGSLTTRGDANPSPDAAGVAPAAVSGMARLRVPWVGSLVLWARTHRVGHVALALAALLAAAVLATAPAPAHEPPRRVVGSAGPSRAAATVPG
ncbi:signal peptidase I [Aquipuribacter sp. SD81]|uniref:signal peptidase I n=1 Tax=Aquipuribacter sp. SD81 TaxID=3127703 RepID=UPI0030166AC4